MVVDHINGNPLDNRKQNLRICLHKENVRNAKKRTDNTSGYFGVCYVKSKSKFRGEIHINGERKHLGYFLDAITAALAYNEAALKYHGKFAKLNICEDRKKLK